MPRTYRSLLSSITFTCSIATTLSGFALAGCRDDAGTDLPGAEPLACDNPTIRTLRVDRLDVPVHSSAVVGDDLDGNGSFDNQSGGAMASLAQIYGDLQSDTPPRVQRRLDGDTVLLIRIEQCDGDSRVTLAHGEYDGELVRVLDHGRLPAGGPVVDGTITAEGGVGLFPIGMVSDLSDTGADGWIQVYPFALTLAPDGAGMSGRISGAFAPWYGDMIASGFRTYLQGRLDAGDTSWGRRVDADSDGTISRHELETDGLFAAMMAPDVDVGGDVLDPPAIPEQDGQPESMSFGFPIHAVDVVVE